MLLTFEYGPVLLYRPGATEPFAQLVAAPPSHIELLAKADQEGERWITLHPKGEEGHGVHVKIKLASDGSAHVVSGPGELRGLRLTKLASPEELAERKKARDEAKKQAKVKEKADAAAKEKADLESSAADPVAAQRIAQGKLQAQQAQAEKEGKLKELDEKMSALHGQLLGHAAKLTGDSAYLSDRARALVDPAQAADYKDQLKAAAEDRAISAAAEGAPINVDAAAGAGSVIAARNIRQVSSGLKALRRDLIGTLVKDKDLRSAVLGEEGEVDPDADKSSKPSGNPGYRRDTKGQAAEQGFTPDDARRESEQVFNERVQALANQGEHERAQAIVEMREQTLDRAAVERAIKDPTPSAESINTPKPVAKVAPEEVQKKAEDVRHFLELHSQLQELERQKRAISLGRDPAATPEEKEALDDLDKPPAFGAEVNADVSQVEAGFAAQLDREIKDAAKADLTRAFLDEVGKSEDGEGKADELIRKAMTAHLGAGAHAHLANVALAALGHEGLDRQVVDTLGVDAAAQLIAHAIKRDGGENLGNIRDGLAKYHDETSLPRMQEAMEEARAARADAAEIEIPPVTSTTDAAAVRDLQKQRKTAIGRAHEALGSALGAVEAGAALNLALKGKGGKGVTVRFGGAATAQVAMQLRALGLRDGEYELHKDVDSGQLTARITPEGMDRLTPTPDPETARVQSEVKAIKSGLHDEADYLPQGFMRRAASDLVDSPAVPAAFEKPDVDFSQGMEAGVADAAGRLYADGWKPSDILRHLMDTVSQDVPDGKGQEYAQAVSSLLPFAEPQERTAKDGTKYTAMVARDVDKDPQIAATLQGHAERVSADRPGEATFHSQRVGDDDHTREALFRTIANNPALQAAFSPPADLGGDRAGRERATAIRNYAFGTMFKDRLGGKSPREYDEQAKQKQDAALQKLGPCPDKWAAPETDLFGGGGAADGPVTLQLSPHATPEQQTQALAAHGLTPEHYALEDNRAVLNDAGKAALKIPSNTPTVDGESHGPPIITGGFDSLNPAWANWQRGVHAARETHPTTADLWRDFTESMKGSKNAYQAVQETMQHELVSRFVGQHAALTGKQLRVSKQTTRHWERRLAATDPVEADRIRARDKSMMDEVRTRDGSGRYLNMGEGGLLSAMQEHIENKARQSMLQGGLFGLGTEKHGGEVEGKRLTDLEIGRHERASIGNAAEQQLAHMLNGSHWGIKPNEGPNELLSNLTWGAGTKHVTKQRMVKMLLASGRGIGWLGAGSGKTGTMLGAFTEAHAQGKARKSLYVVPSIVRNQFGEAAAKFTKPGAYTWHAEDADYKTRKAHYQGETHMVVVTHQTFRDDMVKLMAEHAGEDVPTFQARFERMDRPARAATFAAAMQHHGIPTDMLHVDEAHDFLNRAGKQDSSMSKVLEAALDNHKYKALWTGSPVKNDPSEIHDWLSKVDPHAFPDRDTFMRRYGVNTKASSEALQRLVDSYSMIDSVTPDVEREITWGQRNADGSSSALPLTPQQQQAYAGVHEAFERASAAARRGKVDVEAAKVLSPRSFADQPEAEHEAIAAKLQSALGTLKHSALGRVVNEFEPEHNAKVQHVLHLATTNKGKGGVIFARNRASIKMLKEQLEAQGHRVGVIDGSTTTDGKGKVRKSFDAGNVDIVLCSDAGATGANLQHRGEWLVNYDLPLTQKTLEQRNARIDRLGQTKKVQLHHLVTDTAFDRDNQQRLVRKRELGSILQGEYRDMDDTGLAAYIHRTQAERAGDVPESWEEPLNSGIHENARPAERRADVPEQLPDAPLFGGETGKQISA